MVPIISKLACSKDIVVKRQKMVRTVTKRMKKRMKERARKQRKEKDNKSMTAVKEEPK